MRLIARLLTAIILMFPFTAMAHGYWIELEGNHKTKEPVTIKLIFGEYILSEKLTGDKLDKMKEIKVHILLPNGAKQAIEMKQQADCWKGTFTPETEGSYTIVAINDEREVQDWTKHSLGIVRPIQYLEAIYQVGQKATSVPSSLYLDIDIAKKANTQFETKLSKDNKPFADYLVTIVSPAGNEEELKTGADGKLLFTAKEKGLHIISVQWIDTTPGIFKTKEYKTVRHQLDYSLYVE